MLKTKVFDKADVCMMAHPACYDLPDPIMVAVSQFKIEFKGKINIRYSIYELFQQNFTKICLTALICII